MFYRDRWAYDKVVRSTHGVNCTGSCSWKIYVKDGIITWEAQQTDYPSIGPDKPEYEPRGCPRGASFSWYTYSPPGCATRTSAACCWRCTARPRSASSDPVLAWEDIVVRPREGQALQVRPRQGRIRAGRVVGGRRDRRGGARAHDQEYGPDRVAGFSPIPAMSMVSHAVGARFISLLGGAML